MSLQIQECNRCGHKWPTMKDNPYVCAKCKSPYWNKERKQPARLAKWVMIFIMKALKNDTDKEDERVIFETFSCDSKTLREYIRSLMDELMTIDNMKKNGWTIEMIEPLKKFSENPNEVKRAYHYKNLVPRWCGFNAHMNKKEGIDNVL